MTASDKTTDPRDPNDASPPGPMIPIEDAYRLLGMENMLIYYDPVERAVMIRVHIGKPIGDSKSGKSVNLGGTMKGQVELNRIDARIPKRYYLGVVCYLKKDPALRAARKKKMDQLLEARRLRGEYLDDTFAGEGEPE